MLVTALALASSGCAVHSWTSVPVPHPASLQLREGDVVRAVSRVGTVELTVATPYAYPFLTGRARSGTGVVSVDLADATRVDVREGRRATTVRDPATLGAADLLGRDVQLATAEGPVALRVVVLGEGRVLRGQPLDCLEGEREVPCAGLVRIDVRELAGIEVRKLDRERTILLTTVGVALCGLAGFGLFYLAVGGGE